MRTLADALLRADVPMPAVQRPYELTLETVNGFYQHLSDEVSRFVTGLALWDRLNDTRRQQFRDTVCRDVPARAVARYEELSGDWRLISPKLLSGRIWWITRRLVLRSGR